MGQQHSSQLMPAHAQVEDGIRRDVEDEHCGESGQPNVEKAVLHGPDHAAQTLHLTEHDVGVAQGRDREGARHAVHGGGAQRTEPASEPLRQHVLAKHAEPDARRGTWWLGTPSRNGENGALSPEAPLAVLVRSHSTEEVDLPEGRPVNVAEVKLTVSALPE